MTEPHRPRVKYVIGPDGSPLTIADLPAPGTKRWVIRRKAEVVAAVRGGLLSLEEACARYTLTVEEFLSWQYSIDQHGLAGLRTTRIQQYRAVTPNPTEFLKTPAAAPAFCICELRTRDRRSNAQYAAGTLRRRGAVSSVRRDLRGLTPSMAQSKRRLIMRLALLTSAAAALSLIGQPARKLKPSTRPIRLAATVRDDPAVVATTPGYVTAVPAPPFGPFTPQYVVTQPTVVVAPSATVAPRERVIERERRGRSRRRAGATA